MINAETLAMVKPGAWLINVARGRLIDERALLRALGDGPLGGAVLDTFHDEPLPPDSPFYDARQRHRDAAHVVVQRPRPGSQRRAVLRQPAPVRGRRAAAQRRGSERRATDPGRQCADADRHRRACRIGQDDRLQHAHPRPRRDRRLRRRHAERRGRQGPRRAARHRWPASSSPRRSSRPTSPTWTCRRRPPRPRGTSAPRSCRPTTSRGCATPMRCSMSSARSRIRPHPHPDGQRGPGPRPGTARPRIPPGRPGHDRPSPGATRRAAAGTGRRPSARPPSAKESSCADLKAGLEAGHADPRPATSTRTRRRPSAASGS